MPPNHPPPNILPNISGADPANQGMNRKSRNFYHNLIVNANDAAFGPATKLERIVQMHI